MNIPPANLLAACLAFCGVALCWPPVPACSAEPEAPEAPQALRYWPQWRGPLGTGEAPHGSPPTEWSETKNIRWKAALPGLGHSTPIIWADRIFLTTAIPYGEPFEPLPDRAPGAHDNLLVRQNRQFVVLAVDRHDGDILWQRTVRKARPHEGGHYSGSLASHSAVTDGRHVYAFFGSYGLYCLSMDGEVQWERDLGDMQSKHGHGEGASPALHGDTLVVNWDHEGQSFVAALDKHTGRQLWRRDRDEVTSWATPLVVEHKGQPQVVISGTGRIRGYDLETGRVIWECGGLSGNVVASPVAADGMVYAGSSYEKRVFLAIRLEGAAGDITGSDQVVWSRRQRTPYVPSPLLYGDALYFLRHYQGILTRLTAKTGAEPTGPFRLDGISDVYASPVGAGGHVYFVDLRGQALVIRHAPQPTAVAHNQLNDRFSASPAVVDDQLFLRGRRHLYCIAEQ